MQRQTRGIWSVAVSLVWLGLVFVLSMLPPLKPHRTIMLSLWGVAALLHLTWNLYWPVLRYRHSSYRLGGEEIEIRRGVLSREHITVPRSRVQHTDVSQGPIERRFGLGTLDIFTAGVQHSQIQLDGIDHARALAIRDALLPRDHVVRT